MLKTVLLGVIGNISLALFKGIAGVTGHSYALIADAIESTTDVFSSVLLLIGLWFAGQPPDKNHPYGHGRAESLATFITVAFLVASALIIVYKSIIHILTPHKIPAPFTLVVLLIVVVIKETFFRYFRQKGTETANTALGAEAWHHRSDALTSAAAFLGISISLIMGNGWESADDWAALAASAIIFYNAWLIFRPTLADIMDEDRHDEVRAIILAQAASLDGILAVQENIVRKIGSHYIADITVLVPADWYVAQAYTVTETLRKKIMQAFPQMVRVSIQLNIRCQPEVFFSKTQLLP